MARLVSINKIDSPLDYGVSSNGSAHAFAPGKSSNGICAINMDCPQSSSNNMRKTPSVASFCTKRSPINVEWENISLVTKKGTLILKELSGAAYSGELTAIMGPSGAGKTTLLNVLSGFTRQKVSGKILVNGTTREMRIFRKQACYILQDDHILPRLTVREIVTIAASLKIPHTVSKEKRMAAVDECLRSLGLTAQQNRRASELSGGQRKRLCIAQELVSNPPLIFLDEPTSGLDSSSCLQCIQLLKSLAEEGRTVVFTIHQPSSKIYEIFDKLYMLAEGECIYRGSTRSLVPFLSEQGLNCPQYHNPTDFLTEVAMGDYGDWNRKLIKAVNDADDMDDNSSTLELQRAESSQEMNIQSSTISLSHSKNTDKSSISSEMSLEKTYDGYAASSFNQFRILFCRSFMCSLREPMNTHLKLGGNVVVGLLLGSLYYGIGNDATKVFNNTGLLFCFVIFLIFTAKMPTLLTYPLERTIFEREFMNSWYNIRTYYLATTTAEIPFQILFPIINGSIVYWMSGQPNEMFRFSLFLFSVIMISMVAQAIGQLIGAGSSVQNGVYIASATSVPTLLFCGFFITAKTMPSYLQWLLYSSYARYAFQSMLLSLYSMDRPPLYCNKTLCPFEDPAEILKELDMEGEIYIDYSVLLAFFILFKITTFLVLKFRVSRMW